jgi:hypothetical protein
VFIIAAYLQNLLIPQKQCAPGHFIRTPLFICTVNEFGGMHPPELPNSPPKKKGLIFILQWFGADFPLISAIPEVATIVSTPDWQRFRSHVLTKHEEQLQLFNITEKDIAVQLLNGQQLQPTSMPVRCWWKKVCSACE